MMIKRRLAISNLLMIALPVLFTCVITAVCLGALFLALIASDSPIMTDRASFRDTNEMVAASLSDAFEDGEAKAYFEEIATPLVRQGLALRVTDESGQEIYTAGTFQAGDDALIHTVAGLQEKGVVESMGRVVSCEPFHTDSTSYYCYIVGSDAPRGADREDYWEKLTIMVVLVMGVAVIVSILLTNRFLTHFIFRRIEEPLDILAGGVAEIAAGNLDYRISYSTNDEFLPICTQFNDMAARLKQSVEEIRLHEESRKELMASISHDLRSPLTSIQAYVEGLLDGVADTPEKQARYLRTIKAKAEDIAHMVSQIFLYSKMELEEFPLHMEPHALASEMDAFLASCNAEYAAKGLVLENGAAPDATVCADSALLRRVLTNICDNSLKYKTADTAHLRISYAENAEEVAITLTDDGPGVAEEAVSKLFDVFYRTDPARQNPKQGSGLGLAIVAKAIARMNGTISAQNAQPHGLAITFTLKKGDCTHGKNTDC